MDALENPRFRLYREEAGGLPLEEVMRREAKEMSDRQDAEVMLFRYIIAAACRSDTHPDIPLSLAAYLGKVNDLPSGRILEAAVPLTDGIESGERIDKLNRALVELAPDVKPPRASDVRDDGRPWISVQARDTSPRDRKKEHLDELWRPSDTVPPSRAVYLGKDPSARESRPVFFRVVILGLLAIAVFLGLRTFGCSPKNFFMKRAVPTEMQPPATAANATVEGVGPVPAQGGSDASSGDAGLPNDAPRISGEGRGVTPLR